MVKNGWQRVKFGDVVRQGKDSADPEASGLERYIAGEHMDTDELQITRWGTIGDGYLGPAFHRRFAAGQVLYGSRRTYLRKVAFADFDGICANTTFVCETADPAVLRPDMLPFVMQSEAFHAHSMAQSRGSVNPYVNWPDLAWFEFELPPIEEQREIASILWAVERCARSCRQTHEALQRAEAVRLRGAFELMPFVELGDAARVQNGTTPSRNRTDYWDHGTIPWLPTGKVHERVIDQADEFITEKALAECSLSVVPRGSVLVSMIGQGKTRGSSAYLAIDACVNQNFAAITPDDELDSRFLHCYLTTRYESLRRGSQGSNQGALNCSIVRKLKIPRPDLETQWIIISEIERIEAARAALLDLHAHAKRLQAELASSLLRVT